MWSTKSEARSTNPYCLFQIGRAHEHVSCIQSLDLFKKKNFYCITGDTVGCLKIWNLEEADVTSTQTLRNAHTDCVTGISSSPVDELVFATCSSDQSAAIWDVRNSCQSTAVRLFNNHRVHFTAIDWSGDDLVTLGDECGFLHVVDKRMPKIFVRSSQAFESTIKWVTERDGLKAVCAKSHVVKVFGGDDALVYENDEAAGILQKVCWVEDRELYAVGHNKQLLRFKL